MRGVSVVGYGKVPYGALEGKTLRDLCAEAGITCMKNTGIEPEEIEAFYLGNFVASRLVDQNHVAPFAASAVGLKHIPCTRTEAACSSGALALIEGIFSILAGMYKVVMVMGVEKMTSRDTPTVTEALAGAADAELEAYAGITFPSAFALMARRHMHEFGTKREHLSSVAVKNHWFGARNPYAHMRKEVTLDKAMNSRMICSPLNLYDCSLISDGAAALILADSDIATRFTGTPVDIIGFGQASTEFSIHDREVITELEATRIAAKKAYEMAGVGPEDIQVAEVHDCFTIAEIMAIEDLGFVKKGQGGPATLDGYTGLDGKIPVNTSGGLKSKGHPVGCTGVGQITDIMDQLLGKAGERQVKGPPEIGLAQNMGGSGATAVVTILKRRS